MGAAGLAQGWNSFLFGNGGPQYTVPNATEVLGQGQLLDGFVANLLPAGYEYFGPWPLPPCSARPPWPREPPYPGRA